MNPSSYPVLTLPNEIVCEIFTHFLPLYPLCPPLFGILSPTTLTHICRAWREVALATPVLWRAIAISRQKIPVEVQLRVVQLWLARSGACPLSIQAPDNLYLTPDISAFMVAFAPHLERWQYLETHLPAEYLPALKGPMPLLHHLHVEHSGPSAKHTVVVNAPVLRSVMLDDLTADVLVLPWAQLTSLRLNRVYPYECVPILKQTPNLVYCELRLFDAQFTEANPDILHPHLETLVLLEGSGGVPNYLATFIAPALRTLRVPEPFLGLNPIDSLSAFIAKSGCKLRDVRVTARGVASPDEYRRAFPSILMLSFTRYHDGTRSPESSDVSDSSGSDVGALSDFILIGS
ncbi:hypothetical protein C8R46DRAFT_1057355 [Mycena filopes]|nr:hypothetical protein C8R46DRAFT_1057355 [Mycena filopes]